jgi:tRNA threonylcarbamoyladenosine biosynthesis protein TsaE
VNLVTLRRSQIDEPQLVDIAHRFAQGARDGGILFLRGNLGAGKTTFARAMLGALGVGSRIKSPTYSLIESYTVHDLSIHHLDLYRIADPGELEWLGLPDLLQNRFLLLVEWPERGETSLPKPDLTIALAHASQGRDLQATAETNRGDQWLEASGFFGDN